MPLQELNANTLHTPVRPGESPRGGSKRKSKATAVPLSIGPVSPSSVGSARPASSPTLMSPFFLSPPPGQLQHTGITPALARMQLDCSPASPNTLEAAQNTRLNARRDTLAGSSPTVESRKLAEAFDAMREHVTPVKALGLAAATALVLAALAVMLFSGPSPMPPAPPPLATSHPIAAAATPAAPAAISLEFGGLEHELPSSISSFLSATSSPSPPASSDSASLPEEEEDVVQETTEDAELADEQHQAEENEDTEDTEAMLAVEAVELNIAPAVAARVVTAPTMVAVHNDSFLVCPLGAAPAKPKPLLASAAPIFRAPAAEAAKPTVKPASKPAMAPGHFDLSFLQAIVRPPVYVAPTRFWYDQYTGPPRAPQFPRCPAKCGLVPLPWTNASIHDEKLLAASLLAASLHPVSWDVSPAKPVLEPALEPASLNELDKELSHADFATDELEEAEALVEQVLIAAFADSLATTTLARPLMSLRSLLYTPTPPSSASSIAASLSVGFIMLPPREEYYVPMTLLRAELLRASSPRMLALVVAKPASTKAASAATEAATEPSSSALLPTTPARYAMPPAAPSSRALILSASSARSREDLTAAAVDAGDAALALLSRATTHATVLFERPSAVQLLTLDTHAPSPAARSPNAAECTALATIYFPDLRNFAPLAAPAEPLADAPAESLTTTAPAEPHHSAPRPSGAAFAARVSAAAHALAESLDGIVASAHEALGKSRLAYELEQLAERMPPTALTALPPMSHSPSYLWLYTLASAALVLLTLLIGGERSGGSADGGSSPAYAPMSVPPSTPLAHILAPWAGTQSTAAGGSDGNSKPSDASYIPWATTSTVAMASTATRNAAAEARALLDAAVEDGFDHSISPVVLFDVLPGRPSSARKAALSASKEKSLIPRASRVQTPSKTPSKTPGKTPSNPSRRSNRLSLKNAK